MYSLFVCFESVSRSLSLYLSRPHSLSLLLPLSIALAPALYRSRPRSLSLSPPAPLWCVGAASIGKGIGGILFSRFSRSSSQPSVSLGLEEGPGAGAEGEEPKKADSQSAYGLSTMAQSPPTVADTSRTYPPSADVRLARAG